MADYAKKKNDELANLCKERGLPHTGKKADLVKRLEDHDAQGASGDASASKANVEDEIDWDEPATEPAAAAAIAAGGVGEVANPLAVPNQVQAEDFTKPSDAAAQQPAAEAPQEPEVNQFTAGISETSLDAEIEKRKARARRFGMPEDSEEIKMLERAKRFGTANMPGLLNKALPSERKREGGAHDGGIRKQSRGRPGPGRGRGRGGSERPPRAEGNPDASGGGNWMSEEDRKRAEARKARFAKAGA